MAWYDKAVDQQKAKKRAVPPEEHWADILLWAMFIVCVIMSWCGVFILTMMVTSKLMGIDI